MQTALSSFAATVNQAIARVPACGRFGSRKVFVVAVWNALIDAGHEALSLDAFKAQLIAAQRAQLLSLARADLVAAMPAATVAASEITHDCASWHFVIDSQAREMWA